MVDLSPGAKVNSTDTDQNSSVVGGTSQIAGDDLPSGTDQTLVGIPAFNEQTSIGSTVLAAKEHVSDVAVVDDGSTDKTAEIAERAGATLLIHDTNRGKGEAIQTLLDYALLGDWEAVVFLDGDGQHLPADIPNVVEPVVEGNVDMVIGSRYSEIDKNDETPLYRRFGQRVLDYLTIGSSKISISDSQSGFRALSKEAIEEISISASGYGVESEMVSAAAEADLEIEERPINVRYKNIDTQHKNPFTHGLTVIRSILHLARNQQPLLIFGVPGLVVLLFGMAYGTQGILIYQTSGNFYPVKAMVSGFLTILGVLSCFCGLILNQMKQVMSTVIEKDG